MQKTPTLVVVDVQAHCLPPEAELAVYAPYQAILREVRHAREAGWDIVVLTDCKMGMPDVEIQNLLKDYKRVADVRKNDWSGALPVIWSCREHGFGTEWFRLCGFYTHRCVQSTAAGLNFEVGCRVDVVREACDDIVQNNWQRFPQRHGIRVITQGQPV